MAVLDPARLCDGNGMYMGMGMGMGMGMPCWCGRCHPVQDDVDGADDDRGELQRRSGALRCCEKKERNHELCVDFHACEWKEYAM